MLAKHAPGPGSDPSTANKGTSAIGDRNVGLEFWRLGGDQGVGKCGLCLLNSVTKRAEKEESPFRTLYKDADHIAEGRGLKTSLTKGTTLNTTSLGDRFQYRTFIEIII